MRLFESSERPFVDAVVQLAHCNPFLPERIACEREALGDEFDPHLADWNVRPGDTSDHPNLDRVLERSQAMLDQARGRLAKRSGPLTHHELGHDLDLYEDLLLLVLYHRHRAGLDAFVTDPRKNDARPAKLFQALRAEAEQYLQIGERRLTLSGPLEHLFAGFFQIRRAFENIFRLVLGVSTPAIRLRAAIWESIFTHDMRRYRRALYHRMGDYTTLVTGHSGTGKELVAQAIGLSRYIPFDAKAGKFREEFSGSFYPVNLAALSPTLIESELFGHKRGAFTGAVADREGWFEVCPSLGTVFLDEIGEVDASIQIKLLRVLQSRTFSRLGETEPRPFRGKIIAATNRDLALEMHQGRFRQDFYYRLCSDIVHVPSLHERIADHPDELRHLVLHLANRAIGDEAEDLADEVVAWIDANLGRDYAWPGNIRELEQCLRNVLIRRAYRPPAAQPTVDAHDDLLNAITAGTLTADELLRRYCTLTFAATGSYEATARKLNIDRRTVRAKIDPALLQQIKQGS